MDVIVVEEAKARLEIVEAGRRMRSRGLVVAREGNLSARIAPDRILATPAGADKGELEVDGLSVVDLAGRLIAGPRASTELPMHLAVYRERDDVAAVVHGHPPHATAFAVAGRALDADVLPEVAVGLGAIPLSAYGTPSTEEVAQAVAPLARAHDAFLLRSHGAVALGPDPRTALDRLETVEQLARICWLAHALGGAQPLSADQRARLRAIRGVYGLPEDPVWR
jgi:L-fuculose-phosphate aldolase